MHNTNAFGIQMEKAGGHIARYNLMVDAGRRQYSSGLMVRAGDGANVSNVLAEYNTAVGGWWACNLQVDPNQGQVTASGITWQKNICVQSSSGTQFYTDTGGKGA